MTTVRVSAAPEKKIVFEKGLEIKGKIKPKDKGELTVDQHLKEREQTTKQVKEYFQAIVDPIKGKKKDA